MNQTTLPKKYLSTLMPFDSKFKNVYLLAIKPACQACGVTCTRLDEMVFSEGMLDQIYAQIDKADFIIADMSERNPNVFYEVGYAHALGKNVVMITNNAEDIPFDLKHFQHIVYNPEDIDYLRSELERKIAFFRDNAESRYVFDANYSASIRGLKIEENCAVSIEPNSYDGEMVAFTVDISNESGLKINMPPNKVCLLVDTHFVDNSDGMYPQVERNRYQIDIGLVGDLFPKESSGLIVQFRQNRMLSKTELAKELIPVTLRLFTDLQVKDVDFYLRLVV